MIGVLAANTPEIDYKGLSPLIAVVGGSCLVLMVGLFRGRVIQRLIAPLVL